MKVNKFAVMGAVAVSMILASGVAMAEDSSSSGKGNRGEAMFKKMDTNSDGKVSLEEYLAKAKTRFEKKDANSDGYLTMDEMKSKFRGGKEGGMMDKSDMMKKGKGMMGKGEKTSDMPEPPEGDDTMDDAEE